MTQVPVKLSEEEWDSLVQKTEGFSGSDIATCAADAVLQPIRELESSRYWKYEKGKILCTTVYHIWLGIMMGKICSKKTACYDTLKKFLKFI